MLPVGPEPHELVPSRLCLWDADTATLLEDFKTGSPSITCTGVLANRLYVGDVIGQCSLFVLRGDRLEMERRARMQRGPITAVDADFRSVYCTGALGHISVWDVDLQHAQLAINSANYSIDSFTGVLRPLRRSLIQGCGTEAGAAPEVLPTAALSTKGEGLLAVWDLSTGACWHQTKAHRGRINAMVASHHASKLLLTGGADSLVRLWDATDFRCLLSFCAGEAEVQAMASGSKEAFFTLTGDGRLRVWELVERDDRVN